MPRLTPPIYYPVFILLVILIAFAPLLAGRFYAVGDIRDVYLPLELFFHRETLAGHLPAWMADAAWGFPVIASAQIGYFYPPLLLTRWLPPSFYLPGLLILHFLWLAFGTFFLLRRFSFSSPAAVIGALSFSLGGYIALHLTHLPIILAAAWLPWQLLLIYHCSSSVAGQHGRQPVEEDDDDVPHSLRRRRSGGGPVSELGRIPPSRLWRDAPLPRGPRASARGAPGHSFSLAKFFLLALLLALPFLAGQMQLPVLMALFSASWFLFLRQRRSRPWPHSLVLLLCLAVLTGLLGAVQLLPTYELMTQSTRQLASGTFDITRANQHSFPWYHLPTLLFPRFFANDDQYWGKRLQIEYGFYLGTFPLLMAGLAIFRRRSTPERASPNPFLGEIVPVRAKQTKREEGVYDQYTPTSAEFVAAEPGQLQPEGGFGTLSDSPNPSTITMIRPFFTAWLIISFLLSLGSLSPFRLLQLEPSLWIFSAPARWLLFTALTMSFFATLGAERFFRQPQYYLSFFRWFALLILAFILSFNLSLWLAITYAPHRLIPFLSPPHQLKIDSLLASASHSSVSLFSFYTWLPVIIALVLSRRFFLRHPARWTLVITALELLILFSTTTPTLPWSSITSPPATLAALPPSITAKQARLYALLGGGDTGAYFTNPASRANAAVRAQQRNLLVPLTHTQYNLAGIAWPASLDLARQATVLATLRDDNGYALSPPALAQQLNIGALLQYVDNRLQITATDYAPRLELISVSNRLTPLFYPAAPNGSLQLDLQLDEPSSLIVRDSFFPGWYATVDQQPVNIAIFQDIFRQLPIPAGRHQIVMYYRPHYLYVGLVITAATACLLCLSLFLVRWHRRGASSPPSPP